MQKHDHSESEFDAILRNKLTHFERTPSDLMWKRIEVEIKPSAKVIGLPVLSARRLYVRAAAVVLMIASAALLLGWLHNSSVHHDMAKNPVKPAVKHPEVTPSSNNPVPVEFANNKNSQNTSVKSSDQAQKPEVTNYPGPQFISNRQTPGENDKPVLKAPMDSIHAVIHEVPEDKGEGALPNP